MRPHVTSNGGAGTALTGPAPVFFLSYAPTPPTLDEHDLDPDKLVLEFHAELSRQVERLAGLPPGGAVGYAQRPGHPPGRTLEALARSRVFVPLCSPRYFTTASCGRQWYAFTHRPHAEHAVVPALWAPVALAQQPTAVRELPGGLLPVWPDPGRLPARRYAAGGLYSLITLEEDDRAYRSVVRRLAERIVHAARHTPAAQVDSVRWGPPQSMPDAFAAAPPRPRLGIAVLAPTTDRLPADRDPGPYGATALEWRPYGGPARGPLAERMAGLARNLGFAPWIRVFDGSLGELFGSPEPTGPWVVLVDPWTLHDEATVRLLRRFDALEQPWAVVMSALSEHDPQTAGCREELRRRLRSALPRRSAGGRTVDRAAVGGIPNSEAFGRVFAELVESAGLRFLMGAQVPFRPRRSGPAAGRPRLDIDPLTVHDTDEPGDGGGPEATG